jgi:hypothetical protein
MATALRFVPHDSGGSSTNAPSPFESISTARWERDFGVPQRLGPSRWAQPLRTTRASLTAQHAGLERAHTREGTASHRIVARSSPHASLITPRHPLGTRRTAPAGGGSPETPLPPRAPPSTPPTAATSRRAR